MRTNRARIRACFSGAYEAPTPTASMRKLGPVARAAESLGLAELVNPGTIDPGLLRRLHAPEYVDAFLEGRGPLAGSQGWAWTERIRDGVLAIQAGQLLGARLALEHGIAANVAQGFHHAHPGSGAAFCTFNGLALVAQEFPDKRVFVLDCDQHGGDGTAAFTPRLTNLFNFTINGCGFGCRENERSVCRTLGAVTADFRPYQEALVEGLERAAAWRADLVIYQAGADPHIDDPLGTLGMTTGQMRRRDGMVFEFCRRAGLPVLFVLAGGYQEPVETALTALHVQTFEAAAACGRPGGARAAVPEEALP